MCLKRGSWDVGLACPRWVVFLSLIFWGSLLGLIGMVLSIPFTMALKFVCENNKGTQWIAVLLGRELSSKDIPRASKKHKLSGNRND